MSFQGVHHIKGLSLISTAILLVGEMSGSGVLALPDALANAGKFSLFVWVQCFSTMHTGLIRIHNLNGGGKWRAMVDCAQIISKYNLIISTIKSLNCCRHSFTSRSP